MPALSHAPRTASRPIRTTQREPGRVSLPVLVAARGDLAAIARRYALSLPVEARRGFLAALGQARAHVEAAAGPDGDQAFVAARGDQS